MQGNEKLQFLDHIISFHIMLAIPEGLRWAVRFLFYVARHLVYFESTKRVAAFCLLPGYNLYLCTVQRLIYHIFFLFFKSNLWGKHFAENIFFILVSPQPPPPSRWILACVTSLTHLSVCTLSCELLHGWIGSLSCYLSPQSECYHIFLMPIKIFREVMGKL